MKPSNPFQLVKAVGRYAKIPFSRSFSTKSRPKAFFFGFSPWKNFIESWVDGREIVGRLRVIGKFEFFTTVAPWILSDPRASVYVWAYKHPEYVRKFCRLVRVPFVRVEDGFLRSVALGATKAPPISLCFDTSNHLYFDATGASDLENIIQNHNFKADPALMERAAKGIQNLIGSGLSKYNMSHAADVVDIYGPKDRKRVLVVGQVEGDMSLKLGMKRNLNNNDLVRIASRENPDAHIIYKPHPEVLHGTRKEPPQSNPNEVRNIALVIDTDLSLSDSFKTIDHVYTMTSLAGFEALIRNIKVTCVGMPFYAGWGVTDDRQTCARRVARPSIEEIFAAAYILYPRYFDPILATSIEFEDALDLLLWMKKTAQPVCGKAKPAPKPSVKPGKLSLEQRKKLREIKAIITSLDPPAQAKPKPVAQRKWSWKRIKNRVAST